MTSALHADWRSRLPAYVYLEELLKNRRVLELDADTGNASFFLATRAARVVGIDERETSISKAKARFQAPNLEFRCEATSALTFERESFDVILVPLPGGHLRRREELAELRRVLRPTGVIVVISNVPFGNDPDTFSIAEARTRLEGEFSPVRWFARRSLHAACLFDMTGKSDGLPVAFDGSLLEWFSYEPSMEAYVAVCGPGATAFNPPLLLVEEAPKTANELAIKDEPRVSQVALTEVAAPAGKPSKPEASESRATTQMQPLSVGAAALEIPTMAVSAPQIAAAFARHQDEVRNLRNELEENQAYAAELSFELSRLQSESAAKASSQESTDSKLGDLERDLRLWRSRASVAEGKLLRIARENSEAISQPKSAERAKSENDVITSTNVQTASVPRGSWPSTVVVEEAPNYGMSSGYGSASSSASALAAATPMVLVPPSPRPTSASTPPPVQNNALTSFSVLPRIHEASDTLQQKERERQEWLDTAKLEWMRERDNAIAHARREWLAERDELSTAFSRLEAEKQKLLQELRQAQSMLRSEPAAPVAPSRGPVVVDMNKLFSDTPGTPALGDAKKAKPRFDKAWLDAMTDSKKLVDEIRRSLADVSSKVAREMDERAPSAWAAHRDRQLRDLAQDLGVKDAELAFMHVGVNSLRARLQELVGDVKDACQTLEQGTNPSEVANGLRQKIARFAEAKE